MEVDKASSMPDDESSLFQPNGLLAGLLVREDAIGNDTAMFTDSESLTAAQELESFSGNGLLDGTLEDSETLRTLGSNRHIERTPNSHYYNASSDANNTANTPGTQARPGASPEVEFATTEGLRNKNTNSRQIASPRDVGHQNPLPLEIQSNGLLASFEDFPTVNAATVIQTSAAVVVSANSSRTRVVEKEVSDQTSLLDQLLKETESVRYTSSKQGRGKAGATVQSRYISATYLERSATRTSGVGTDVSSADTLSSDSIYPRSDLATLTEEAETLRPLEAVDRNGRKVVFKRKARKVLDGRGPRPESTTGTGKGLKLLETSYHDLLKEIEEAESAQAALALQKQYEDEDRALKSFAIAKTKVRDSKPEKKEPTKQVMWVDKYRPTKFTDLLGEEEWDKCVFKRVNPLQTKKRARETEELGAGGYNDVLGRPKERVLLMSGPPGLGKTTLAHVVAKQAGYDVFEINASDDRNAGTVSQRIKNALDAGSGLRAKGKPTCVIIDEIDGSAGGDMDVPARKNSRKPPHILKRPIICICNDLYAPVLRPLRPFARIVRFKKAQPSLIVNRLRQICEKERVKADTRGLTRLAEMTNSDVRSCLNTLQVGDFMKSRSLEITEKTLRQSSIGMKDSGASLNAVWHNLFVPVSTKGKRKQNGVGNDSYVNRLAFEVQSCGDQDKVVQAQEFELMTYTSYAIVPWYSHFASPANVERPTDFPKADYESYVKASTNKDVGTALLKSIPPNLRALYNSSSALTELVPLLMRIISPNLKPVNANLVRADDKVLLGHLVDLMLALNLSFYRDKTEDGQPMFRLDPPIDVFIHYDGKRAADIAQSRFAVRQLVAQAMEAEAIRRKGGSAAEEAGKKDIHSMFKKQAESDSPNLADKPPVDFFGRLVAKKAKLNDNEVLLQGLSASEERNRRRRQQELKKSSFMNRSTALPVMTVTKRRVKAESAEGTATEPGGADITHTVRIKCAAKECPEVDLCPGCFSKGEEKDAHKAWHDYKIVETHSKPIFTEDWGADEELLLITGLQQYGLGNWQDVAEHVGTRYKEECEKHYLDTYINDRMSGKPFMPRMKAKIDITQEEFQARKRARIEKMRQPAPIPLTAIEQTKASAPTNHEVAGFMPGRLEFEHEVENDAEMVIKDMEFGLVFAYGGDEIPEAPTKGDKPMVVSDKPVVSSKALPSSAKKPEKKEADKTKPATEDVEMADASGDITKDTATETRENEKVKQEAEESEGEQDTAIQPGMHLEDDEDLELKLAALEIYYEKLQHRAEVKDFIFDRALMDYKRMQKAEKNKSKEEKDLIQRYKVFAKAQTAEDYEVLLNGLHYEQMLRKRIAELQDYRRLGILTASDASRYEKMRVERISGYRTAVSSMPREPSTLAEQTLKRSQGGLAEEEESKVNDRRTSTFTFRDIPRYAPLQLSQADALPLLTPEEQALCSSIKILPRPYLVIKDTFIRENARRGGMMKRKDAR
ncbi:hypothetical protein QFC19_005794 [Naganishia cerealis]|uniref:Uncharacterized protein n=1 Tax=Naganishia cerealis TaxID=610337 RepID=A0ACC2VLU7_9TREE|nr:hypothetical protein QFC19_005794 [Naganishia cerealis]